MTTNLQTRIVELSFNLKETDWELSMWILAAQKLWNMKHKHVRAEQRAWVGRKTKGRAFKVPSELVEESGK